MDTYDRNILKYLQEDARVSNVDLASLIHLSPPQTLRRVRNLEEAGLIRKYTAQLAYDKLGYSVTAFVGVSLAREQFRNVREAEAVIRGFPEIVECYTISGDFDYLIKVVSKDLKSMSLFLTDKLMQVAGISEVKSMICLEEIKPPSPIPVDVD
jgi:Lrp/AsnC family leucine-responsive transcriptional regulator